MATKKKKQSIENKMLNKYRKESQERLKHITEEERKLIQEIENLVDENDTISLAKKEGICLLAYRNEEELKEIRDERFRELMNGNVCGKKSNIPEGGDLCDILENMLDFIE